MGIMFVYIYVLFVCYDDDNYVVLKVGLELEFKLYFVKKMMLVYMYFVQLCDILLLVLYRIMMYVLKIEDGQIRYVKCLYKDI